MEQFIKSITEEIADMISTKTIIGDYITIEGRTIIPVTKVCFGFGSGGGEGKSKAGDGGTGGGGAGGAVVQPIAFLVVTAEDVQLLTIKGKGALTQFAEVMPEIAEKCKTMMGEHRKEESSETGKTGEPEVS
ncbi:MAG: sporulation protein [ANME-2 cluster archaeon]|nr:sporulation protein [ANME-2 cluster archaeon]